MQESVTLNYQQLEQKLKDHGIEYSITEIHGLISGISAGYIENEQWFNVLYTLISFEEKNITPNLLAELLSGMHTNIVEQLSDPQSFNFQLLLTKSSTVFEKADAVSDWVNHFLLGLGMVQQSLEQIEGEAGEAIKDLQIMCQLSYSQDNDTVELEEAVKEIIEYLNTISVFLYNYFADQPERNKQNIKSKVRLLH